MFTTIQIKENAQWLFVSWNKIQGGCADVFTRPILLWSHANWGIIVAPTLRRSQNKRNVGTCYYHVITWWTTEDLLRLMIVVGDKTGGGNACGRRCKSHTTAVLWLHFINPPFSQNSSPLFYELLPFEDSKDMRVGNTSYRRGRPVVCQSYPNYQPFRYYLMYRQERC